MDKITLPNLHTDDGKHEIYNLKKLIQLIGTQNEYIKLYEEIHCKRIFYLKSVLVSQKVNSKFNTKGIRYHFTPKPIDARRSSAPTERGAPLASFIPVCIPGVLGFKSYLNLISVFCGKEVWG